jgi:hypothetical protein
MLYFCTYFDQHYLPRALALYDSLARHGAAFRLWALCMDEPSFQALQRLRLPGVEAIALEEFERGDAELQRARQNRSRVEYFFTCTPSLPLFILGRCPEVDVITYLDADLFFFADPQLVMDELAGASIGIVEHRFAKRIRGQVRFGIYNVGWLSFRRDAHGLDCLRWWRERCLEWCYDRVEERRYADQKYLDDWPVRFPNVRVIRHKGANLAAWNIANYRLTERQGQIWVDEDPLIFFHFQGFKQLTRHLYSSNFGPARARPSRLVRRRIIGPYIATLWERTQGQRIRRGVRDADRRFWQFWHGLRQVRRVGLGLLAQEYVVVLNGRVL